ncbi:DNA-binding protein [Marmoricola endophyticus]|uniref:DNA-binding protein n=2 Tax=Marmoricola endophyticus TaxID=2040280 RepID=A0A917EY06_9ACTN|nr:DNA-binding protein [Marmoricola endophyticus]
MLLLVDAAGVEYAVPVDARLHDLLDPVACSASSGSAAGTPGAGPQQREPTVSKSTEPTTPVPLRPREIQDRVRAGESAETIAETTGNPVAKVLAYAGPVLAERAHVADTALSASVRRSPEATDGQVGPARTLGDACTARAVEAGIEYGSVEWDAWRREDGRWTLTASYSVDGDAREATFSFDHRGRFVTPLDDAGRWLVGEAPLTPPAEPDPLPVPGASAAPVEVDPALGAPRRLRLAPPPDLPDTGAVLSSPGEPTADVDETPVEEGMLDMLFDHPLPDASAADDAPDVPEDAPEPEDREDTTGLARRHPRKQRGRASVPSWDEIMFGGRD